MCDTVSQYGMSGHEGLQLYSNTFVLLLAFHTHGGCHSGAAFGALRHHLRTGSPRFRRSALVAIGEQHGAETHDVLVLCAGH